MRHIVDFDILQIMSPKRTRSAYRGWQGFFPYYAGYPLEFAERILATSKLTDGALVLDPWNGSGTTTFAAADAGISSIGLDLNPVMVIVARARTLAASEADALVPLARRILDLARAYNPSGGNEDELLEWCDERTTQSIRAIESAVRQTLVGEQTIPESGPNLDMLSAIAATQYVALFGVLRILAGQLTTTNPTWLKKPRIPEEKLRCDETFLHESFMAAIEGMAAALLERRSLLNQSPASVKILNSDSTDGITNPATVDLVLTSPPYCTRIDYVAGTRLELALLQHLRNQDVQLLRAKMLGSTRAPTAGIDVKTEWGVACAAFLDTVKNHRSKASSGYYYRTHTDYYCKLSDSLKNLGSCLKPGAAAILVVQDSYYKDVHNDVPRIMIEMCAIQGLALQRREDFKIARTMAGRHKHVRNYRRSASAVESVLCFSRT
jgi:SAM-dependent methyltransferase